ncbi:MAG: hypothetical protein QOD69_1514 [Solirubrobacteraceae bacterium]|nr:hypothetical protein [Solirubrobacteraceae bacterium]
MNNKAMDGHLTTAHGALLVVFGLLLCICAAPASALAAPEPYIVVYKTTSASAGLAATADIASDEAVTPTQRFRTAVRGFAAELDATDVAHIRSDPRVAEVVRDQPVKATGLVPLLAGDNIPPGIRRVGAAVGTTVREASRANVAVIDTGIDLSHPDLNAVAGIDCTGNGTVDDGNGHGTHVSGTIAARNNGSGAVGVAPGSKLWAVRVLGSNGSGWTSQVICGIDWVTATRTDADPDNDIAVANMSLGSGSGPTSDCGRAVGDAMHIAVCNSVAAGVTYVVAAGNSGGDEQNFAPASYPEVITVTATADSDGLPGGLGAPLSCYGTGDDTPASFSNYATRAVDIAHTIAAPGVCIRSTYPGGYATMSGTSMASPHVTGLVALCEGDGAAPGPCWGKTPGEVRTIVRQMAADQSAANPGGGFAGDPTRPTAGRYYGYLGVTRVTGAPAPAPVETVPVNSVTPVVTGTASVGSTLTSTTGTWSGSTTMAYARQWMRCTSAATTSCTAISGATAATYVPVTADAASYVRVRVTASNVKGAVVVLSEPTAAVVVPVLPVANTVKPVVSGSPVGGVTLSSTTGTWTGTAPIAYARQWQRCTSTATSSCAAIGGATGASYLLTTADIGRYLRQRVTASNARGPVEALSESTAVVTAPLVAPANTVKPAVSGAVVIGVALSSTTGTWTGTAPLAYARQWMRCTTAATTSCAAIGGATGASYVVTTADVGRFLRLRVTGSNAKSSVQALSEPTAAAATAGAKPALVNAPAITGTVRAGSQLVATTGTWTGGAPMTFTVSWATCAPGSSTCYYNGATGTTFTPPLGTPVGTRVVAVVTAQNLAGVAYGQSMTSAPLAA